VVKSPPSGSGKTCVVTTQNTSTQDESIKNSISNLIHQTLEDVINGKDIQFEYILKELIK